MPKATKRERQRQNREMRRQAQLQAEQRRKRLRTARNLAIPLLIVVAIFAVIQLTSGGGGSSSSAPAPVKCVSTKPTSPAQPQQFSEAPPLTIDVTAQYSAVLHTSCGDIQIALDSKQAPQTVNSFLFLISKGYYNGTTFHRIVTDFVDQGGKNGDNEGPGYTLPDEPPKKGYQAGDVAMANSGPNTSGSQFFLVVSKNGAKQLNSGGAPYKYSILGHMDADGLRVAQKINTFGSSDQTGTPTKTIYVFDAGIIPPQSSSSTTATPTTTAAPTTTSLAP
ncbi:MAG TPA: peptidylprolyl isomerase [Acidimicrobiia bacterium]|nr:peptidylprolyl isomerase [Acidimicrobiia bacterium]